MSASYWDGEEEEMQEQMRRHRLRMRRARGEEIIADFLRHAGLDAETRDGWVYITHKGDRLWIGAEYGASLGRSGRRPYSAHVRNGYALG